MQTDQVLRCNSNYKHTEAVRKDGYSRLRSYASQMAYYPPPTHRDDFGTQKYPDQ